MYANSISADQTEVVPVVMNPNCTPILNAWGEIVSHSCIEPDVHDETPRGQRRNSLIVANVASCKLKENATANSGFIGP